MTNRTGLKNQIVEVLRDVRELVEKTIGQTEKGVFLLLPTGQFGTSAIRRPRSKLRTTEHGARFRICAQACLGTGHARGRRASGRFLRTQIEHASKFMHEFTPKS